MTKRVLVTGATGFIGRHVLNPLVERGFEVHAVARQVPACGVNTRWHRADLLSAGAIPRLIEAVQPTHVLHLAWSAVPGHFWTSPENLRWVQVSLELLCGFEAAGGHRIVVAGSCAEYEASDQDCDERETPLRPVTLYGTCKHALGLIQEHYAEARLSASWGRVFHLYGPFEHPDRLVPSVITSLLDGRPALCTPGSQVRDFLYVQDAADAFAALVDSEVQGPVNIASGTPISVADVVRSIGAQLHAESHVRLGAREQPPNDPPRLTACVSRLRQEVRWRPALSLDEGLSRTIEWWRSRRNAP
jgi:nucleoside-diphosphate-sugar epimerase